MPQCKHVDTQLVAAPGVWRQADAGLKVGAIDDLPIGPGRAAILGDLLTRAIVPIAAKRQLDGAAVAFDPAMNAGNVGLLRAAVFEFLAKKALRLLGSGEKDDTRGVTVKPVDQQRIPPGGLQAGQKAILPPFKLAGNGKKARRLVKDKDLRIFMQKVQRGIRGEIVEVWNQRRVRQSGVPWQ